MSFIVAKISDILKVERERGNDRERQKGSFSRQGKRHDTVTISAEARERSASAEQPGGSAGPDEVANNL
jgi:hypothetical protein